MEIIGAELAMDRLLKEVLEPNILLEAMMDNWKHRSKGMSCKSCMWYNKKDGVVEMGRCRKHAPTMNGWPVMMPTDWCGDHKLDENYVEMTVSMTKGSGVFLNQDQMDGKGTADGSVKSD